MKVILCVLSILLSASARKGFGPSDQNWGFVTVRQGAHIFWWLHRTLATENYTEKPLIIWLQGGPGASSTGFGNFAEIGPFDADLNPRNTTWINNYNVLFVDNPVGTGYSHVDSSTYLATNNKQIAQDFIELLKGFYEVLPELRDTPVYIFSESYGGKMAAEIALLVDKQIKEGFLDMELAGVGLGDAWISPIDLVLSWASYLLHVGAVDHNGYKQIQDMAQLTKSALDRGHFIEATQLWAETEGTIALLTENIDFYNILTKVSSIWKARNVIKPATRDYLDDKIALLMNTQVREALDLNVTWGDQAGAVFSALVGDFMKPVTDIVELLLNTTDIKVAVYNGQLDLIVDTPGTVKWVDELKFEGSEEWKNVERKGILSNGILEGYYKKLGNFAMYWVNRAGHMVPLDNPDAMNFILEDMVGTLQ
ncbi:retinoid-inducible serine carboxypeptidase-like [Tribolium madens]|uniref:retinoid-inducible serine carboxypeptidase-like n=1 Tax=Tribolium madens TaxID=41895 RepID=UPI001CF75A24|nr:retinoid-inducible serine carboxypeptidase-like [Tribolium madens]